MSSSKSQSSQDSKHVTVLNELLNLLRDNGVSGPQLFRLDKEFKERLGEGSEGSVRGIDQECAKRYRETGKRNLFRWPVEAIAIKRHQASSSSVHGQLGDKFTSRLAAAKREVLALSPSRFRGCPNIVQLKGWGLCLDTIENPGCGCCGAIQMPLLVLERAYKNLWQFLQEDLFPERATANADAQAEEGRAFAAQNEHHPTVDDANACIRKNPVWAAAVGLDAARHWTAQRAGLEDDPYNVVRLLCIDIGHALQSLHDQKFTHGDLKPHNVLVFQNGLKWVAKLCDFGCAQGQGEAQVGYRGTIGWQPRDKEMQDAQDHEGFQNCDRFVYGLIVWSAFFLRGEAPECQSLEEAKGATNVLRNEWNWLPGNRHQLADQINSLFENTLCDPNTRHQKPWTYLYEEKGKASGGPKKPTISSDTETQVTSTWTLWPRRSAPENLHKTPSSTPKLRPPLSIVMKQAYTTQKWWPRNTGRDDSRSYSKPLSSSSSTDGIQDDVGKGRKESSVTTLVLDDNHYSRDIFRDKHRDEVRPLIEEMIYTLSSWSDGNARRPVDLYYCARFRSRIPLLWWKEHNKENINFVVRALTASPAVDICTLAWLCNGPVGKAEVLNLPNSWEPWSAILDPDILNESERLDRFLLLLQFGAPIEKELRCPERHSINGGPRSALRWYLRSCRPAILPFVIREIGRRFNLVKHANVISSATRAHLTGINDLSSSPSSFTRAGAPKIIRRPTLFTSGDAVLSELTSIHPKLFVLWRDTMRMNNDAGHSEEPTESTPLTRAEPEALPPGWKKRTWSGWGVLKPVSYYEDEYTRSITLTRPKKSILLLHQIQIGHSDPSRGVSCTLDLAPYTMSRVDIQPLGSAHQKAETRFPVYDDDWFAMEQDMEVSHEDVLGKIRDIASFAPLVHLTATLVGVTIRLQYLYFRALSILLLVAVIIAFLALLAALFFIIWTLLPALLFVASWMAFWTICFTLTAAFALCMSCVRDCFEDSIAAFYIGNVVLALPLTIVFMVATMKDPCPGGAAGVFPDGQMCHRCWWVIWNFLRCRVG
jgi:serine/threonine protein kinase